MQSVRESVLTKARRMAYRPIQADDEGALEEFHSRLSPETVYLRFFSAHPRLSPAELHRFTHVDYRDRYALVATDADDHIVGVGRYDRLTDSDVAEVAFVVDDAHQGQGVGSELLRGLVPVAIENGIRRFVAETMVGNQRMLGVFRDCGMSESVRLMDGLLHVELQLEKASQGSDGQLCTHDEGDEVDG